MDEEIITKTERYQELKAIADKLGDDKKTLVSRLIIEVVFMEGKLEWLRSLPHLRYHPTNPAKQQATPAWKQYKETEQAYNNAIKIIMSALNKLDTSAADELAERLKEFEL